MKNLEFQISTALRDLLHGLILTQAYVIRHIKVYQPMITKMCTKLYEALPVSPEAIWSKTEKTGAVPETSISLSTDSWVRITFFAVGRPSLLGSTSI